MTDNVRLALVPSVAPLVAPVAPAPKGGGLDDSKSRRDADRNAQYRLVIEEGTTPGTFVYKTLDRVTGEVIRQLPREEVIRMGPSADYDAGAVIDTTV